MKDGIHVSKEKIKTAKNDNIRARYMGYLEALVHLEEYIEQKKMSKYESLATDLKTIEKHSKKTKESIGAQLVFGDGKLMVIYSDNAPKEMQEAVIYKD